MLSYDEMPENNEDLAKIQVSFPELPNNSAESCPASLEEIMSYLSDEGEKISAADLQFVRTAQVADKQFWVWRFLASDSAECYATVSVDPDGNQYIMYDENYFALSPEQFMLGVYHQVF